MTTFYIINAWLVQLDLFYLATKIKKASNHDQRV